MRKTYSNERLRLFSKLSKLVACDKFLGKPSSIKPFLQSLEVIFFVEYGIEVGHVQILCMDIGKTVLCKNPCLKTQVFGQYSAP